MKNIYVCILISLVTLLTCMEIANAQIKIGENGNVTVGTGVTMHDHYKLRSVCDNSTNCTGTNRYGISGRARDGEINFGVHGRASDGPHATGVTGRGDGTNWSYGLRGFANYSGANHNRGIQVSATNASLTNYGIYAHASGSGSTNYAGYFAGNVYTTGSYLPSDERLKTNIRSLRDESMVVQLGRLTPTRYEYLSKDQLKQQGLPESHASEGEHLGLLAQEVAEVFPELVREVVHFINEDMDPEAESYKEPDMVTTKAVNYDGLIVALIAAMQEQQQEIEELKRRLDQSGR